MTFIIANFLTGYHVCFHDTHGYQLSLQGWNSPGEKKRQKKNNSAHCETHLGVTNGGIGRPIKTIPPKTLVFQLKVGSA